MSELLEARIASQWQCMLIDVADPLRLTLPAFRPLCEQVAARFSALPCPATHDELMARFSTLTGAEAILQRIALLSDSARLGLRGQERYLAVAQQVAELPLPGNHDECMALQLRLATEFQIRC